MSERRFTDAEVAAIFEEAARAPVPGSRQVAAHDGMTLAQLQEIGREVGMSPEQLAHAAKSIELGERVTLQSFAGMPIGVGVTVELGRKLTDAEWERVVVDLRETFDARGKQTQEGSFRQWTNGNLQALLEPSAGGHRLRLRTLKGSAQGAMIGGLAMLGTSSLGMAIAVLQGQADQLGALVGLAAIGTVGLGMIANTMLRLPSWARLRRDQMEQVGARTASIASLPAAD